MLHQQVLPVALFFLAISCGSFGVEGFQFPPSSLQAKAKDTLTNVIPKNYATKNNGLSSAAEGPQNSTTTTTTKKTVFVNQDYVETVPVRVVHVGSIPTTTSTSSNRQSLPGGPLWLEMSQCLSSHKEWHDAAQAVEDVGMAWIQGDWEGVTYAALDASLRIKLVAVSMNKRYKDNQLQQALAAMAQEFRELSNATPDKTGRILQRLSLKLHQASQASTHPHHCQIKDGLQQASQAARKLAKLQGASTIVLPRRIQLWWQDNQNPKDDGEKAEKDDENGKTDENHDGYRP